MKSILCLTCGKKDFKTEQEGIDHMAHFAKLEEETRWNLTGKTTWVNGVIQGANPDNYVPRHIVQISMPVGVSQ